MPLKVLLLIEALLKFGVTIRGLIIEQSTCHHTYKHSKPTLHLVVVVGLEQNVVACAMEGFGPWYLLLDW